MNLITGEKIQTLCDYYIGTNDDFNFNPVIRNQSPKHINIDNYNMLKSDLKERYLANNIISFHFLVAKDNYEEYIIKKFE